jgi:citrate lyase subunit beta/citryl-CoA lyase/(S)-citramalyl-CoA lyase
LTRPLGWRDNVRTFEPPDLPMNIRQPRSMLFVSGEKVERFAKAMAAGADLVCIDLEDAVHPDRKDEARSQVLGWLKDAVRNADGPGVALRVNGLRTLDGLRDVLAFVASGVRVDWLLLPKAEHAGDVQTLESWCGTQVGAITALLESPLGIENAASLARAGGKLGALMLGGADLSAELDAKFDWEGLRYARGRLVNAAKSAGLQAWDVPNVDLSSNEGLAAETRSALALGFGCKTAIHPQQIKTIHAAFTPTPAEIEWATLLLQAVPEGQGSGAFLFQGKMVDAPLLKKARRIAELAKASS